MTTLDYLAIDGDNHYYEYEPDDCCTRYLDPHFDPFWARVNEAEISVILHIGVSGYFLDECVEISDAQIRAIMLGNNAKDSNAKDNNAKLTRLE